MPNVLETHVNKNTHFTHGLVVPSVIGLERPVEIIDLAVRAGTLLARCISCTLVKLRSLWSNALCQQSFEFLDLIGMDTDRVLHHTPMNSLITRRHGLCPLITVVILCLDLAHPMVGTPVHLLVILPHPGQASTVVLFLFVLVDAIEVIVLQILVHHKVDGVHL